MRTKKVNDFIRQMRFSNNFSQINLLNDNFVLDNNVYIPGSESFMLINYYLNQKENNDKNILDYGTGSSYLSLIIGNKLEKANLKIVATDINPIAINCARKNIKRNGLENIIDLREGDCFTVIKKDERFDTILASLPYHEGNPHDWFDYSFYDENLKMRKALFENAKNYLTEKGVILFTYSQNANEEIPLEPLIEKFGFNYSIKDRVPNGDDDMYLLYEIKIKKRNKK